MDNHLVLITTAGTKGKFTGLICENCFAQVIDRDKYVFNWYGGYGGRSG